MPNMTIDLSEIKKGLPGLTPTAGANLYENCIVCLTRQSHSYSGTDMEVTGDSEVMTIIKWEDIYSEQLERTYKEQTTATNFGAVCIAILLALKLTDYTVVMQAAIGTGIDYWLSRKDDVLFQNAARLEVSGIFNDKEKVNSRYSVKIKQTNKTDETMLPAYVGIVEFSTPIAKFGIKK